jgi:hypothetical protein
MATAAVCTAVPATLSAANIVLPKSPDTTRLAMNGIRATINDNRMLDSEISIN